MAFLAPLLGAGMSTGILPNLIKGVGGFVSDLVGGIGSGKPFLETLGGAAKRGLSTVLGGGEQAPEAQGIAPVRAISPGAETNVANSRPMFVSPGLGMSRVVPFRREPRRRERYDEDEDEDYPRERRERRENRRRRERRDRSPPRKMKNYYSSPRNSSSRRR